MEFNKPLHNTKSLLKDILNDVENLANGKFFISQQGIILAMGNIGKMTGGKNIPKGMLTILSITCHRFLEHNPEIFEGNYSDIEIVNSFYEEYLDYFYDGFLTDLDKKQATFYFLKFLDECYFKTIDMTNNRYNMLFKACLDFEDKYLNQLIKIGSSFDYVEPFSSNNLF